MDAKLIVVGGKTSKGSVDVKSPMVIGRSRKATLTIAHPMISRRHCELFESDGLLMVRDMDSLNGTLIDGRRIKQAPLPPQGEFMIGPLTFRAEYEYEGDPNALPETVFADPPADQPAGEQSDADAAEAKAAEEKTLDEADRATPAEQPPAKPGDEEFDIDSFLDELK